ncbi:MAG: hypothetical protein QGI80_03130 [archaeon]|jgi:hypothetical protein|nr:hypothetical protein [archaeon]|tara:strand:+ start:629 stop:763 length:135 start_codon:yes stop_codon:yes gene_type:complete
MVKGTDLIERGFIDKVTGEQYPVEISLRDAMLFDLLSELIRRTK